MLAWLGLAWLRRQVSPTSSSPRSVPMSRPIRSRSSTAAKILSSTKLTATLTSLTDNLSCYDTKGGVEKDRQRLTSGLCFSLLVTPCTHLVDVRAVS